MADRHLDRETTQAPERCALCIVGGGVAGLNALFSASVHLTKRDRVVLIEKNPRVGGMWTETYDYVRLHQPHPMFTAGNIPWTLGREPAHLASKPEVLDHLQHCLEVLRERVDLVELYGHAYTGHDEVATPGGTEVVVRYTDAAGAPAELRADRLIKSFGYRIEQNDPLPVSSERVHSVAPHEEAFLGPALAASDAPVFVVGGGKTGMDTVYDLVRRVPGREVHLLAGAGTVFTNRDRSFPAGAKRWWSGHTGFRLFRDFALHYNGDNEQEATDWYRRTHGLCLNDQCKQFMFGVLSEHENETISKGLAGLHMEYFADAVDEGAATRLHFRSGGSLAIPAGSWIVNTSGHIMKQPRPYEPYLSDRGAVLSIQPTSAVHFLTTVASYFLTHLFMLGTIETLPLYELNQQDLLLKNKRAWAPACATQALYNTMLIAGSAPPEVLRDFGLNFDLWFPTYRRLLDFAVLKRNASAYGAHCRATLDRVAERYGIESGVLPRHARNTASAA